MLKVNGKTLVNVPIWQQNDVAFAHSELLTLNGWW